jgi:hypothetical protein
MDKPLLEPPYTPCCWAVAIIHEMFLNGSICQAATFFFSESPPGPLRAWEASAIVWKEAVLGSIQVTPKRQPENPR